MDAYRQPQNVGRGRRKKSKVKPPPGEGYADCHGLLRIVVAFDQDTFTDIRRRALREGTSFAHQVRLLVEWGLLAK